VLYVKDRRVHYTYNFVGLEVTTVSSQIELPVGPVVVRVVFERTGGPGRGGNLALYFDDIPVGEGTIEHTTPLTYGMHGFAVGFQPGGAITRDLPGSAHVPAGLLKRLVIEAHGRDPIRDVAMGEATDADLAMQ
jgi:hypothetical protein